MAAATPIRTQEGSSSVSAAPLAWWKAPPMSAAPISASLFISSRQFGVQALRPRSSRRPRSPRIRPPRRNKDRRRPHPCVLRRNRAASWSFGGAVGRPHRLERGQILEIERDEVAETLKIVACHLSCAMQADVDAGIASPRPEHADQVVCPHASHRCRRSQLPPRGQSA